MEIKAGCGEFKVGDLNVFFFFLIRLSAHPAPSLRGENSQHGGEVNYLTAEQGIIASGERRTFPLLCWFYCTAESLLTLISL